MNSSSGNSADFDHISYEKIEEIVREMHEPSEVAAWNLPGVEDRMEKEGYSLTQAGRLRLRAVLTEIASGPSVVRMIVDDIDENLEMSGFPSSDEEAEEILSFLRSDAGETFKAYFKSSVFKSGVTYLKYLFDVDISTEELIDRMEEAIPRPPFDDPENPPEEREGVYYEDRFFEA
jgi:hypothetical protein